MTGFDTFIMVDWSGGNDRGATPKKDAIWTAVHRSGVPEVAVYHRNRLVAEQWLRDFFNAEQMAGRRVLAGFDFAFGYPKGFAKALTGQNDPFAVWDWFETQVTDTPKGNNRFDLAGQINLAVADGTGPFWFNGLQRDVPGLPRKKAGVDLPFAQSRIAETQAKGSFSTWQMGGAGAVGGQVFMGLPMLNRLRKQFDVSVWPFEPLSKSIAFVEIWPSLTVGAGPKDMIKDTWQVTELARQVATLPLQTLQEALDVTAPEEGWIFGLGFEGDLQTDTAPPPLRNDCFALPPGVHWTPVDEALDLLRTRLTPVVKVETLPLAQAMGTITAAPITANRANPPLPNTAVDGYGFAGGVGAGPHRLALVEGRAAAGDAPIAIPKGHAIRVLTGAALPHGVDTVVLQEDVVIDAGHIAFNGPLKQGANARRVGEDVAAGDVILPSGRKVTPADLALLSAVGQSEVVVHKPLRVGVLSTGDELVEAGNSAAPGQIYDANRPMLLALMDQLGHQPVDLGRCPDNRDTLRAQLDAAASQVDVILTSGGASAGDEDHVSALLQNAGAMSLWRIAIKPGRPLALAMWHGTPVFGLPGNPVAALVCTLIFAQPALNLLAGAGWTTPQRFKVPSAFTKTKKAGRREYLRARIRDGAVEVFASEGSGRISGLSWAEGLVELSEPAQTVQQGDLVSFIPYASFSG